MFCENAKYFFKKLILNAFPVEKSSLKPYLGRMKRLILIIFSILVVASASAQPKSVGARCGAEYQLSYQHDFGRNADFLEVDLGYELITNLVNIACSYDFMLAQPQWTAKGEWGVYVGPAVKAGFAGVGCYMAAGAQVGLEYTFEFPLQLSLDFRPVLGAAIVGGSASIYGGGPATFCPGLSVRYRF